MTATENSLRALGLDAHMRRFDSLSVPEAHIAYFVAPAIHLPFDTALHCLRPSKSAVRCFVCC